TLAAVCTDYLDLADRMLRQAKRSRGLIDAHLRESYGPDVDSLYYYLVNLKRLGVRLDELGLREIVRDIRARMEHAVAEFTDDNRDPIVEIPGYATRVFGRVAISLARRRA
ncbi:MAG: hypothetical protein KGI93_10945, partial [Acidobacteriota bacterium]|nr:hypothetical protein [Acidobacteriota bacterium]